MCVCVCVERAISEGRLEVGGAQVRTSLSEQEECVCVCVCVEGDFRRKVGSRWGTGQNVAERARREGDDVARGNDVSRGGGKAGEMEEIVEKEAASSSKH